MRISSYMAVICLHAVLPQCSRINQFSLTSKVGFLFSLHTPRAGTPHPLSSSIFMRSLTHAHSLTLSHHQPHQHHR